jgi:hypothetical protein
VPACFFAVVTLYALTRYVARPGAGWAILTAAGLGLTLLTREIVVLVYGPVVVAAALGCQGAGRCGRALVRDAVAGGIVLAAAVALYLGYNAALTGHPFLLPRLLFNSADVLGFGEGIGFYGEHTVASGLVNAEQQLVSLGFYLAGWPYGFSLALMSLASLPLLLRRWLAWDRVSWDLVYVAIAVLFVGVYVTEFYHGIVFGPRYYFEALPAFAVLSARGFSVLSETVGAWLDRIGARDGPARARLAAGAIGAALLTCNAVYFLPRQATLYADYTGLPGGGWRLDETIGPDLAGRTGRLENALVVTDQWWWYTMHFAALNCPRLDCPALFALGEDEEERERLRHAFPDRQWYDVVERQGVLTVVPGEP